MVKRRLSFLKTRKAKWAAIGLFAALDAALLALLVSDYRADAAQAERLRVERQLAAIEAAKPKAPPPPEMIHPLPVATALQSGTLIVISKASQSMYVFNQGALWASTPISTGKRRHETPSGIFPILQKRRHHRSNIYSNAPMPFMQRLTWEGIALHAGRVPGYAASHGCVRLPPGFAQALFKLTNMKATTVVIGDHPLESDLEAQQFALSTTLPIKSALAPPPDPNALDPAAVKLVVAMTTQMPALLMGTAPPVAPTSPEVPAPAPPPALASAPKPVPGGQTIQLAAAATPEEAAAYWSQLRAARPDIRRFQQSVEIAQVNARRVYRLRISGPDAHGYCAKLKSEGVDCLVVG